VLLDVEVGPISRTHPRTRKLEDVIIELPSGGPVRPRSQRIAQLGEHLGIPAGATLNELTAWRPTTTSSSWTAARHRPRCPPTHQRSDNVSSVTAPNRRPSRCYALVKVLKRQATRQPQPPGQHGTDREEARMTYQRISGVARNSSICASWTPDTSWPTQGPRGRPPSPALRPGPTAMPASQCLGIWPINFRR